MSALSGSQSLEQHDPVLFDLIEKEKFRQWSGLELIASENFTSKAVMECLGSCLTNKVLPFPSLSLTLCLGSMLKDTQTSVTMVGMNTSIKLNYYAKQEP
jgi:hypothetical protein